MRRSTAIIGSALAAAACLLGARSATAGTATTHLIGPAVDVGAHGNEPIVKAAPDGSLYISALEYVYVSLDGGATWHLSPGTIYNNPAGGGGVNLNSDSSIDVDPGNRFYLTFDYPYAGITAVCWSDDHAQTYGCDPGTVPGGTDRMWLVTPSTTNQYLVTNEGAYQTLFYTSAQRGSMWTPRSTTTAVLNPDTGPLIVSPASGNIFQPYVNNASNVSATTNLDSGPIAFHVFDKTGTTAISAELTTPLTAPNALPSAGFTTDDALYLASEEPRNGGGYQLTVARSTDQGASWVVLPPLAATTTTTQTFSAIATGAPGHVGVLYYQTSGTVDPTAATTSTWDAVWAETTNADTANPTWTVQTVDRSVHTGPICSTAGCTGDNRYSGDFISASFDAAGNPNLTWVKDLDNSGNNTMVRYAGAATPTINAPEFPAAPLAMLSAGVVGAGITALRRRRP